MGVSLKRALGRHECALARADRRGRVTTRPRGHDSPPDDGLKARLRSETLSGVLHRRDLLGAFAAYALLAELSFAGASRRSRSVRAWLDRQEALAEGLVAGSLEPEQWRQEVEALGREADVARLIAEALPSPSSRPFPTHPARRLLHWRDGDGNREASGMRWRCSSSTAPASSPRTRTAECSPHLVARGALRARTYDRVSTEPDALVLRPAADRRLETGETSSIGPGRENVHWFVPLTEGAATFDVLVTGLDPGGPDYQVQPVDPLGATELGDGTLRAPLLGFEESARRYARS